MNYEKLLSSARTGIGLTERTNDLGHTIRDAWLNDMVRVCLPAAIEALLEERDKLLKELGR